MTLSDKNTNRLSVLSLAALACLATGRAYAALPEFNNLGGAGDTISGNAVPDLAKNFGISVTQNGSIVYGAGQSVSTAAPTSLYGGTVGNITRIVSASTFAAPDQPAGFATDSFLSFTGTDTGVVFHVNEMNGAARQAALLQFNTSTGVATTIFRDGANAPGVPVPFTAGIIQVNTHNQVAISGALATNISGSGVTNINSQAHLTGSAGSLTTLIRQNSQGSPLAAGERWGSLSSTARSGLSANGIYAGGASLQDFLAAKVSSVVYRANVNTGAITLLAREGQAAPGGGTYRQLNGPNDLRISVSSDDYVAFSAKSSATAAPFTTYIADPAGTVTRWLGPGDAIADRPGYSVRTNSNTLLKTVVSGGRILQYQNLSFGGSNAGTALLFGAAGDIKTVAMTGDTVAGLADGLTLNNLSIAYAAAANDAGQIFFQAQLQGAGIVGGNDMGWFAYTPAAGLQMLFQEGGTLTGSDGVTYNVGSDSAFSLHAMSALNNNGDLVFMANNRAFHLNLNDLTAVPEPASMAVLGLAAAALLKRRRGAS